jgi:hypothetical protein
MDILYVAAVVLLLLPQAQDAASLSPEFDYSKVDRKIASRPKFVAEARYALLLLGDGKTRIWMAWDKTGAEASHHNVLYFDLDADGNLGEEGEKFVAKEAEGQGLKVEIGKVEIKGTKIVLDDVKIMSYTREKPPFTIVWFRMNGKVTVYGGYGPKGTYLQFGESPEKAPILHADPWGTLSFFHAGPDEMNIGGSDTFMIYVGARGSGSATFMAVDESFLDLEKDKIFATVIAKDRQGNELRKRDQLKEHC